MVAIKLKSANAVFTGEGYLDVPATTYQHDDGTPGIEICLELTPVEIAELAKSRRLYLYKIGKTLQPFYLSIERDLKTTDGGTADEI